MAKMCAAIAAVLAVAALLQTSSAQTVHIVGDGLGWLVPPGGEIAYETWVDIQTFVVGDVLVFDFPTGVQDVARVTKEAFDSCNSTSPIFLDTTGPFNYTLDAAGEYYFIGTMYRHCYLGQKLAITVSASAGPTPSPQAPTPTSPRGPVTYVVGDDLGWLVPPGGEIAYETWADIQTFVVGDVLVFDFPTGVQDVARVTKEAFDSCNSTSPIFLDTTGPFNYTLDAAGEYYFIGTMYRHCYLGQKLAITVSASAGPTPSPQAPTPTSPRGPVTYVVGDDLGWLVPPGGEIAYETWADIQTFVVGDVLVFDFPTGVQDVARVTKEAFDSCNSTSPIFLDTTGPFNYTLDAAGEYYFIGTMYRHCYLGQKLAITVSASAGPTPSPQAPTPTPPQGPVTYVVGDDLGWVVPPGGSIAYKTWAYKKTFLVGDVLVFNFANETQDVAVVKEAAYDSCDTTTTTAVYKTSPVKYTLTAAGEYFFTSTYARHCDLGQKLAINVTASSSATPPSTTTTRTPSTNPSSSTPSPTAGGPSAPTPESSAPARTVLGFSSTLLLIALAFVH